MSGMPFRIAEKRKGVSGESASIDMTRIVHLSPRRASTLFGAQGVSTGPFAVSTYGRPWIVFANGYLLVTDRQKCAVLRDINSSATW